MRRSSGFGMQQEGIPLAFLPDQSVASRLEALGRTEDVKISPDGRRLAIAGFTGNKILVIEIAPIDQGGVLTIASRTCVEITCEALVSPHGLAWLDDGALIVASRQRGVAVIPVPQPRSLYDAVRVEALLEIFPHDSTRVHTPGSVAVSRLVDSYYEVLVCNNYAHHVSRHLIRRGERVQSLGNFRFFEKDLRVPDGIAISSDGGLVAVSNHDLQRIDLFLKTRESGSQSSPVCSLPVAGYPHGVLFGAEGRFVLVADAGAPFVHVFVRPGQTWSGTAQPAASIRVMDDETFKRGRVSEEEGGPKGIDLSGDAAFFVVSCETVPIAFFDFRSLPGQLLG